MSLSASTVSSATPSRSANFTTAGSHNWKSPQLLHKRISGHLKLKAVPSNEFIMNKTLDDMAVSCNIPQWLIYSWTSKARDKNLVDRKTQQAIAEVILILKLAFNLKTICIASGFMSLSFQLSARCSSKELFIGVSPYQ